MVIGAAADSGSRNQKANWEWCRPVTHEVCTLGDILCSVRPYPLTSANSTTSGKTKYSNAESLGGISFKLPQLEGVSVLSRF